MTRVCRWFQPLPGRVGSPGRCALAILLLAAVGLAADRKERVFDVPFEKAWTAATSLNGQGYVASDLSKQNGRLALRTGPLRPYRFHVTVAPVSPDKTRVQLELRSSYGGVKAVHRRAWTEGDRYFKLIGQRLSASPRR